MRHLEVDPCEEVNARLVHTGTGLERGVHPELVGRGVGVVQVPAQDHPTPAQRQRRRVPPTPRRDGPPSGAALRPRASLRRCIRRTGTAPAPLHLRNPPPTARWTPGPRPPPPPHCAPCHVSGVPDRHLSLHGTTCNPPPPPPCVTFRRIVVSLRGPGQSPVHPFACCVGLLRSVGRCGRCSCWCRFRVCGAQWLVCRGCAGCGRLCRLRVSCAQSLAYWGCAGCCGGLFLQSTHVRPQATPTPPPPEGRWPLAFPMQDTRLRSNNSQKKRLFSDIARGAFRCDLKWCNGGLVQRVTVRPSKMSWIRIPLTSLHPLPPMGPSASQTGPLPLPRRRKSCSSTQSPGSAPLVAGPCPMHVPRGIAPPPPPRSARARA